MWFQTEMAMAHRRLDQLGEALVKLHEIDKVATGASLRHQILHVLHNLFALSNSMLFIALH